MFCLKAVLLSVEYISRRIASSDPPFDLVDITLQNVEASLLSFSLLAVVDQVTYMQFLLLLLSGFTCTYTVFSLHSTVFVIRKCDYFLKD